MTENKKAVYTVAEAAQLLGMAQQGVRECIKRGKLPIGYVIENGGRRRYIIPKVKLDSYLGKGQEPSEFDNEMLRKFCEGVLSAIG
jgi:excisionase family DNA binding protein